MFMSVFGADIAAMSGLSNTFMTMWLGVLGDFPESVYDRLDEYQNDGTDMYIFGFTMVFLFRLV